jgi:hypothetical protein
MQSDDADKRKLRRAREGGISVEYEDIVMMDRFFALILGILAIYALQCLVMSAARWAHP